MLDIFNFIFNSFSKIISFLDDFKILGTISLLRLFIIIFIFNIIFKFLLPNKED